ncbi:MAG: RelA/SpoT domain-containing protein [Bdellovibrionales bacterium]|nr:RelA/SpoT domain-containing protein [Bdellovibrionales bacterium]
MNITRNRIKNIGKKLRALDSSSSLNSEDLMALTRWRDSHGSSLNYILRLLEKDLSQHGLTKDEFSITQRLKRIYSIKLKLTRFENMQLSMMDDIAGIRVILSQLRDVDWLFNHLKEKKFKYTLLKVNNYVSAPKPDGYRSIHLVYRTSKSPEVQIEVQLRTHLQHVWATAVEVFGTIVKTSFKTGDGENEWREFFKLLSSKFSLKELRPVLKEHELLSSSKLTSLLISKIKDLNVIEKLNAYTSCYHSDWEKQRGKGRMGKYALLILDNIKNTTSVEFYAEKDRLKGLQRYSELEKDHIENESINTVFISVDNMNKLIDAYPNYFMNTKDLINYLSDIVLGNF